MTEIQPLVDPKVCSNKDLQDIIATHPNASPAYKKELDRRELLKREAEYWEDKFKD
jgi:hypothetical protein